MFAVKFQKLQRAHAAWLNPFVWMCWFHAALGQDVSSAGAGWLQRQKRTQAGGRSGRAGWDTLEPCSISTRQAYQLPKVESRSSPRWTVRRRPPNPELGDPRPVPTGLAGIQYPRRRGSCGRALR
ncbi:hypothetical protein IWZ03DRAFT_368808 [Phyllosticta citriasiana]|uniref:Secreted protein n=1 Tax=Phyllosticta citriasiana TaxID=595635 RepID=A0ABR1KTM1_9PEZI